MMRAGEKTHAGNDKAAACYNKGFELESDHLSTAEGKAIFEAIQRLVVKDEAPTPEAVRAEILRKYPKYPVKYLDAVVESGTGLISKIPALVDHLYG